MKRIEVDDDIYAHLVANTAEIGESASSILRRLLGLGSKNGRPGSGAVETAAASGSTFAEFLGSPSFQRLRNVKDRFLAALAELHRRDEAGFDVVLGIGGRKRKYFGKSREDVAKSGKSVAPREIPGSPYWVMTNASTSYKQTVLRQVMEQLGYDGAEIRVMTSALTG